MIELLLEEHVVEKKTIYGTVQRSLGQDKVYIRNEDKVWKHCGFLTHITKTFLPLVGVPQELVQPIAMECARMKCERVGFVPSVPVDKPEEINGDEDES